MDKIYTKILCPTDFTSQSANALKKAVQLSSVFGSELILANIIDNPWEKMYAANIDMGMKSETIVLEVEKMVKEFAEKNAPGITFDILVKNHEQTYLGIIEYAENEGVDLIVMATQGRTGAKRFFMGSVAERVFRLSPCSVLVVR